jgi:DNA-binding NarL/FixJ family response regulator
MLGILFDYENPFRIRLLLAKRQCRRGLPRLQPGRLFHRRFWPVYWPPAIILTTSEVQKDIEFTMKAGAESFITKPATFDEWVEMMKSLEENWLR